MSTLPLYWKLSSSSKNERIGASVELISALEQFQEQFVPPSDGTNSEEDEHEHDDLELDSLDAHNSEDVRYAIKRLIRGLGSPKESSRLGFAVALTELLSRIRTVTASQIIQIIIESSQTAGSMKGQEIRDMMFARLFGFTSVIRSNLLFSTEPIPRSNSPPALLSDFETVITELISLGEKKSWLRESAWWSVLLAVEGLHSSEVEWKNNASQVALSRIFSDPKDVTSESIALALKMQTLFPALNWKAVLVPVFTDGNILSPSSLGTLAKVFRDAPLSDDDNDDIRHHNIGHWNPQLHFVWDVILDRYLDPALRTYNAADISTIFDFYRVVVDESLFSSTSSPERKSWGFQVVQKLLNRIPSADIPLLFTQNFMRSWTNYLSGQDRYLHKEAVKVASAIQAVAANNPNIGYTLLLTLVGKDHKQFDNLTKTKTVESILSTLDAQGVQGYVDYLVKKAAETTQENDPKSTTRNHTWVADQVVTLIRNASVPKSDEWISRALQFLVLHSFFNVKKKDAKSPIRALQVAGKAPLTEDGHGIIRIRLYSTLAHLIGSHQPRQLTSVKDQTSTASTHDRIYWVNHALETVEMLSKNQKYTALVREEDDDTVKLRKQLRSTLDQLKNIPEAGQNARRGVELLLISQLLLTYDEKTTDLESFEQCNSATIRQFALSKSKHSNKKAQAPTEVEDDDQDLEPIDIILDTLIGYMENSESSTSFTREMANTVLGLIAGELKQTSIDLLTTQLIPRDPLADEEGGDDDSDEEDGNEDGEGLEMLEAISSASEPSDEQSGSEDQSSGTQGTDDEEGDPELRKRIAQALQVQGMVEGQQGDGIGMVVDDESEDEVLMDDDQMMALDEKLAEIFKSTNKAMKKKHQDAQRVANVFRGRILELIETYVKREPSSKFITQLIRPLLDLAISSGPEEQHLSSKATKLLQSRISQLKEPIPDLDVEKVLTLLQELHNWAKNARQSPQTTKLFSQACLYVSRLLIQHQQAEQVEQIYQNSLEEFIFKRKSKLGTEFFQEFTRRNPSLAWNFRGTLMKGLGVSNDVGAFKRGQVLQLIRDIFSQCHPGAEYTEHEYTEFMCSCANALYDIAVAASKDPGSMSSLKLRELLQFTLAAVKHSKKAAEKYPPIITAWNLKEWQALSFQLLEKEQYNSSKPLVQISQELIRSISSLSNNGGTSQGVKRKGNAAEVLPTIQVNGNEGKESESVSTHQNVSTKKGKAKKPKIIDGEESENENVARVPGVIDGKSMAEQVKRKKRKGATQDMKTKGDGNVEEPVVTKRRKKSMVLDQS